MKAAQPSDILNECLEQRLPASTAFSTDNTRQSYAYVTPCSVFFFTAPTVRVLVFPLLDSASQSLRQTGRVAKLTTNRRPRRVTSACDLNPFCEDFS